MTAIYGIVKDAAIIVEGGVSIPEGTQVLITPLAENAGSPQVVLQAASSPPHIDAEDVEMFEDAIIKSRKSPDYSDPFAD